MRHLLYSVITSYALSSQSVEPMTYMRIQLGGNLCHCVQEAYAYLSKHTSMCVCACARHQLTSPLKLQLPPAGLGGMDTAQEIE